MSSSTLHPNGGAMPSSASTTTSTHPRDEIDLGYGSEPGNMEEEKIPSIKRKQSGVMGTSANLINTIVGAGIIGIPYAFKQSGWIAGLFLLCFVGYLTDKSLRIMLDLARFHKKLKKYNISTFEKLATYPFGGIGKAGVLCSMFIMGYGAMVAYLLIIKDTVPTLLGFQHGADAPGIEREIILVVTSMLIMLPLSMQRDMANLSYTSAISVTADIILVIFVFWFSPISESIENEGGFIEFLRRDSIEPTLFIGLGVLSTAMACQHSAFIVSGSLSKFNRIRWNKVTSFSIALSTMLCVALGSAGYFGFLDDTQGDVLNNFGADNIAANGARGLLAITMLFTYPMEAFVVRHVISSIFYKNGDLEYNEDMAPTSSEGIMCGIPNSEGCCNRRHRLTLGIYICTLIPALIFDDLGPVLSITGALGGSVIAYILPGLVYLGINGQHFINYCHIMLGDNNNTTTNADDGNIELPVAGNSSASIINVQQQEQQQTSGTTVVGQHQSMDVPVEGQHIDLTISIQRKSKPMWWFLLGYPIWYGIASTGAKGMEQYIIKQEALLQESRASSFSLHSSQDEGDSDESTSGETLSDPTWWDYFVAKMFITFGIIAAVAGLFTNIYVIVKDINVGGA